jgi:hypothetical protein
VITIDSAILNLTESLCRTFQRLTGRTNVWLAVQLTNVSIIIYFVWAGLQFLTAHGPARVMLGVFCGTLLVLLSQTILKTPIETHEQSAFHRVANGLRNPRRLRDAPLRIPFLTLSVLFAGPVVFLYGDLLAAHVRREVALLGYSLVVLTTIVLYLLACDPLPPRAGTVKAWLRGAIPSQPMVPDSPAGEGARPAECRSSRVGRSGHRPAC